MRTIAATAALVLVLVAAACGASGHRSTGPGGVSYQWPPPASVARGEPTPGRFCALLIDDYQHLKAAQQGPQLSTSASPELVRDYLDFIPGLVAAAPSAIASPFRTYYDALSGILQSYAAHDEQYLAIPPSQLDAFRSDRINAAWMSVDTYAVDQCHYDISANVTTPGAKPPPP